MPQTSEPPLLPSGFAVIQSLSESVLRHWPPSAVLQCVHLCPSRTFLSPSIQGAHFRDSLEINNAWHTPYDAALISLRNLQEDITLSLRKAAFGILAARNRASPVQSLPTEVLRQVFMHLKGDIRAKLALTQTCSAWRELMIEDPFMWTSVDLDTVCSPVIASKIFRRAKEYPLQLTCHDWNELRLNCASFELGRVEELETTFTVPMFRNLCKRGAPLLKRFRIAIPRHSNMITYLPYLFAQTHPVLKDLTMIDCRLMFTPDNYRGLTRLDIRFSRPMMSLRQDEDFLYIFRGCPGLEELRLENMNLYRDTQDYTDVVHLAQLRTMHIRLSVRDMACLLSAISAPPSLRLSMVSYGYDRRRGPENSEAEQPCLRLLAQTKYLDVDHTKNSIFAFREVDDRAPSLCRKVIQSEDAAQGSAASDLLARLVGTYPMPHLLKVRTRDIAAATLIQVLQRCPSITTLEIIFSTDGIGDTAVLPSLMEAIRSSEAPVLANLRSLSLERVHMDVNSLFDIIELRRACPEFHYIHLHYCHGELSSGEMIELLKGEFITADWSPQSLLVEGLPYNDLEHAR